MRQAEEVILENLRAGFFVPKYLDIGGVPCDASLDS